MKFPIAHKYSNMEPTTQQQHFSYYKVVSLHKLFKQIATDDLELH